MAGPYSPSDSRNYVGVGRQTSRGTGVAPTLFLPYLPSVDLDHGLNVNKIMEAGSGGQVSYAEKSAHLPSGKVPDLGRPSLTAKLFAYLMGVAGAPSGAGPYVHTITDDFSTDYVSIEQNLSDEAPERFIDCAIAEVQVVCDVANPTLRVTAGWVGGEPDWRASATAESYETDDPFLISQGAFTLDGSVVTNVKRFSLTARMKLSLEQVTDVTPDYVQKHGFEVEVEVEQLTTDISAEYRKALYGAVGNSAILRTPTTASFIADFNYGAGAAARQLKWHVPNGNWYTALYTALSPDGSEATKVVRTMSGRKVSGTALMTVTATTNDSTGYLV